MNYRLLSKVFGILLFIIAGAMALGWLAAMIETPSPQQQARLGFFLATLITASFGTLLFLAGSRAEAEVLRKESIVVVGGGWLLSSLFGSLPYLFCRPSMNFAHAFFESTSGFTTTGSTVITDLAAYPNSLLLYRSLTQWLGGLGILVLFIAVLSFLGVGNKALMQHESSLQLGEKSIVRIHDVAVRLWIIYISLTLLAFAGLWILGMPFTDSIHHALTSAATAGFSPKNESIAFYDSVAIESWLIFIMAASSLNFIFYLALLKRQWTRVRAEEEGRVFLLLLLSAVLVVGFFNHRAEPDRAWTETLRETAFPVVALGTTTGYATSDYDQWPPASRFTLALLMLIGGCAGSTAGGIKLSRIILGSKIIRQELVKTFRPNQIFRLRLNEIGMDDSARKPRSTSPSSDPSSPSARSSSSHSNPVST